MELKGRQDLYLLQKPEVISALREKAVIQSSESSNRIEGVHVEASRLQPLLFGKARPRNRSEEEVLGYKKALNWIHSRKRAVKIDEKVILHLHATAQAGTSGDAGEFRKRSIDIVEMLPNGERLVRFHPPAPKKALQLLSKQCQNYATLCDENTFPSLLLIATFVFDFLCVHPFRDGNGRVSSLLSTMLLQEHGFQVGRYCSLERLIEDDIDGYYDTLKRCSDGWHKGQNELIPWWTYFLTILKRAYEEFEEQVEASAGIGKSDLVRHVIEKQIGKFSLSELQSQCPSVSSQLIKKILAGLKKKKKVRLKGRGPAALWELL